MFDGLKVSESFLLKTNVREFLFRKPAADPLSGHRRVMARPVIALLTDFGTRDHYAGTMKAVVLGICPDATLVDITHDIPPHDMMTAALELAASYKYFPAGTIFLVVVDPGVGSARRGIAADTGDYRFVAPDNGVLTAVLKETPAKRVVELTERRYARPTVSRTFEGRDRFAPAAGWLAKGVDLSALGRSAGAIQQLAIPSPEIADDVLVGRGAARRSLRQPRDEHRSEALRQVHPRGRHRDFRGRAPSSAASSRRTPRLRPAKCARCSAAPTISRSPSTPAAPAIG